MSTHKSEYSKYIAPTALLVALFLLNTHYPCAMDWPQWHGPNRDGMLPVSALPSSWPSMFQRVWQVEIGEGYSSPVLAGNCVLIHSRRDPDEVVTAIDLSTGKILWRQSYPAPFQKNQFATRMSKGPFATPLVLNDRLYTLGTTGILAAWNIESGSPIWTNDYSKRVVTTRNFCGTAASPLALPNAVLVQIGSDVHGGWIVSLDPAGGKLNWDWQGPGPGYASPVLIDVNDHPQVVTLTNQSVIGLDSKSGRELWSIPFSDQWQENIVTPLWTGVHLVISGIRRGTFAYRLLQQDDTWNPTLDWKNTDVEFYMSSPVYDGGGVIYGFSAKKSGQFVALDSETGKILWSGDGRMGENAAVFLSPDYLISLTNKGILHIFDKNQMPLTDRHAYQLVESETWAMPVILDSGLLVRDVESLIRLAPPPSAGE